MLRRTHLRAVAIAVAIFVVSTASASAQGGPDVRYGPGYGMGPSYGMGPWYHMGPGAGYGMGPGMMMGYGPGYGAGYGLGPGMGRNRMHQFATVDTDGNGVISADEAAARVEEAFTFMDLNGDGVLTLAEFTSVHMGFGPGYGPYAAERQKQKEARFREMDPGKTGSVSRQVFLQYGQKRFEAADTDKDGKVTPWEYRARARIWSF